MKLASGDPLTSPLGIKGGKQGGVIAFTNGSFLGGALSPPKGDEAISINQTFAIGSCSKKLSLPDFRHVSNIDNRCKKV
jgi:hypothetical protein